MSELDPRVVQGLSSKDEVLNYVRAVIQEWKDLLKERPDTSTAITSTDYIIWERKNMMRFGAAHQAVVDAHIYGVLSLNEMLALQLELKAQTLVTHADAQIGKPR